MLLCSYAENVNNVCYFEWNLEEGRTNDRILHEFYCCCKFVEFLGNVSYTKTHLRNKIDNVRSSWLIKTSLDDDKMTFQRKQKWTCLRLLIMRGHVYVYFLKLKKCNLITTQSKWVKGLKYGNWYQVLFVLYVFY